MFIYLFILRERARASRGGAERRRDSSPSRIRTVGTEPDLGLELPSHEILTRAEIKSQTFNRLCHPDAPI